MAIMMINGSEIILQQFAEAGTSENQVPETDETDLEYQSCNIEIEGGATIADHLGSAYKCRFQRSCP